MIVKDVVVVGSGGAGMTAALVAAKCGLEVLLVEKTEFFGGTTALSGGGIWVPCSPHAVAAGVADSVHEAATYVKGVIGESLREDLLDEFLESAPQMVQFLVDNSAVQFSLQNGFADWHPQAKGFKASGRLLSPLSFDGKLLGDWFSRLRPPLTEFNAPGGCMIGIDDMPHISNAGRSLKSFAYVAKLLMRYFVDRIRYPRGTRLTMGNALAGSLLKSCVDAGVELWSNAAMENIISTDGTGEGPAIQGLTVNCNGQLIKLRARKAVILATGGFSANAEMRKRYIPFAESHVSLVPDGNTGDGIQQCLDLGAVFDGENISNAGWVVVSVHRAPDGKLRKFPHLFMDRGKPGCIAVNKQGNRFGNESTTNLVEAIHRTASVPAYLICDHVFIKKYGLGLVKPGGFGLRKFLAEGYIKSAESLPLLAQQLGIDSGSLVATVTRFNQFAEQGHDQDFLRGGQPADFGFGDMQHKPNPCLGKLDCAPFYAVEVFPGDSTTTVGLRVDSQARVLNKAGKPIKGLHAIGLDMNSLWRGKAPANGANNTLGMTFGYIAAQSVLNAPENLE
ncbi:MAG: succinate dehydrogenase/fumarate reductase flavoprotein subunit [Zhongshania aliphaticivorans]|jgi:succinate dehydrogenase/fumarate reductase flavoprotein subunit